jgi:hypothetical protein
MSYISSHSEGSYNERKPLFANLDAMKENVKRTLFRREYNVTDFYKDHGCCQAIARHPAFDGVALAVIMLYIIWIGFDTDFRKETFLIDAHPVFQVGEHTFTLYFTCEVLIRFGAFRIKRDCLSDPWFVCDSLLVFLMVLETWVINVLVIFSANDNSRSNAFVTNAWVFQFSRLLRLTRMVRMAKLVSAMPELMILIKGMAAAARSVFFTLLLLLLLLYVFGIAFRQILEKDPVGRRFFNSVPGSMHTLWLYAALNDEITTLMSEISEASIGCVLLLDVFILISTLTVMNMLVGVLCQVVGAVSASEKEELSMNHVRNKVKRIFDQLDSRGDEMDTSMITQDQFEQMVRSPEAIQAIQNLGVDVVQMVDMADHFFAIPDGEMEYRKELSFPEFMDAVVQLRGSNYASVKDLVNMRNYLSKQLSGSVEILSEKVFEAARMQAQRRPSVARESDCFRNRMDGDARSQRRSRSEALSRESQAALKEMVSKLEGDVI